MGLLEQSSRPPINSSHLMSQDILMPTSRLHGTTSTKTTRDGSDMKRPTPSKGSSTETSTDSLLLQDLLVTLTPVVPTTFSHTQLDLRPLQSAPYERAILCIT